MSSDTASRIGAVGRWTVSAVLIVGVDAAILFADELRAPEGPPSPGPLPGLLAFAVIVALSLFVVGVVLFPLTLWEFAAGPGSADPVFWKLTLTQLPGALWTTLLVAALVTRRGKRRAAPCLAATVGLVALVAVRAST